MTSSPPTRPPSTSITLTGLAARHGPLEETWLREIGHAEEERWIVPMERVIGLAQPAAEVRHVTVVGDGEYRASIPLDVVRDSGRLILGGSGPLPPAAGGPIRFMVPEGETLCWNVKSVSELRFTIEREPDSVPENPPH